MRIHSFALDGPRLVSVRIGRDGGASFEPCFVVVTDGGAQVPNSQRCDGDTQADRDVELSAGRYFVLVTDKNNALDGPYRLPAVPPRLKARDLSIGPQCRTLDGLEDLDIYRITLSDDSRAVAISAVDDG
jgi:hypothetical protein